MDQAALALPNQSSSSQPAESQPAFNLRAEVEKILAFRNEQRVAEDDDLEYDRLLLTGPLPDEEVLASISEDDLYDLGILRKPTDQEVENYQFEIYEGELNLPPLPPESRLANQPPHNDQ
jgi:hypothetical protein